jgi:hypothetical protein
MSEEELRSHSNPDSFLYPPADIFDGVAIPMPPGTKAPPRPPGRERVPGQELPAEGPIEIFECNAIPVPPGTKAPPRPPGKERRPIPPVPVPSSAPIDALVLRIESALATIQEALAEIKDLRSRAG